MSDEVTKYRIILEGIPDYKTAQFLFDWLGSNVGSLGMGITAKYQKENLTDVYNELDAVKQELEETRQQLEFTNGLLENAKDIIRRHEGSH